MRRTERGSGSLLVVAVMIVVLTMAGAAMIIGGYLIAAHRARAAADLAALSGAAAIVRGQDGCHAVRDQVSASARVSSCQAVGDQIGFVISVDISVAVPVRLPGLPRTVTATATAGPVELARRSAADP